MKWPTLEIVFHEHTGEFSLCGCGGTIEHEHVAIYKPIAVPLEDADRSLDPYVMYLVVKTSLKMNVGKTAAQCGHAVQMLVYEVASTCFPGTDEENARIQRARDWLHEDFPGYRKIVLAASDAEFEEVKKSQCFVVTDRGLAGGVAAGTETVLGLWPCRKSDAPASVKTLKLLR